MIKRVTVTKVYKNEANREGVPYVYKTGKNEGKPFNAIAIFTDQTGDTKYYNNALLDSREFNIAEGQSLILKFEESKSEDGSKTFFNWKFPTQAELEVFKQFDTAETTQAGVVTSEA